MAYVLVYCQGLLAAVFTAAALGKLSGRMDFREFVKSLRALGFVPHGAAGPASWALVIGEIAAVPLVVLAPAFGLALAALLLAILLAGAALVVRSGAVVACQCFGSAAVPLGRRHVARNAFLLTLAILGYLGHGVGSPVGLTATVVCGAAGMVSALVVVRLDDIVYLFIPNV